ncbi:sodium/proline symporter PutP [Rheinheimera sp.]|uniref:sodium/proline symporter PutP n=1 Tax=Rheinheimera sp. TaxID=1869214 RepID=UPI00307E2A10
MATGTMLALAIYFFAMLAIGVMAYRQSSSNLSEYMLGGRKLGPSVTALSAGASDMSGWLLMGVPGAMYALGLSQIWIGVGLVIGAYLNYILLAPRFRVYTELAKDSITLPDYLENRFADPSRMLRLVSALVIVIFFTLYTSSGMVAGGKLFETVFQLDYRFGLFLTAGVVIAYTLLGGFLAVSMTDFVQGMIMFVALVMVPVVAYGSLEQPETLFSTIEQLNPTHLDLFTGTSLLGIISLLAWGLGYFGQPHIIVRFMAIRSVEDFKAARRIGMSWMIVSLIGAMAIGFVGIAYVHQAGTTLKDPETIFIYFSQILFHPFVGGLLLAAILAAIMSTVSSQLLVTSSALTQDFYKTFLHKAATDKQQVLIGRLSVLLVALIAIGLALDSNNSILSLVADAWAGFGAAFGPVVLLSLYWSRMNHWGALAGISAGAVTVLFWVYAPLQIDGKQLDDFIYAMIPGVLASALATVLVSRLTSPPAAGVQELFGSVLKKLEKSENN